MDEPITPKTLPDRIEAVIEELAECAVSCPRESLEQDAIFAEMAGLAGDVGRNPHPTFR